MEFSIIIPCYNAENTILGTLVSLENQEYKSFEVLCIDDGSTDQTKSIIKNFSLTSRLNLKIISQSNKGVSAARNNGIKNSSGDVLFFLDADDKYSPSFLKTVIHAIDEADTVYGYFTHDEKKLEISRKCTRLDIIDAMKEFTYHKERCHTSAFAYKKSIINQEKLYFEEGSKYGEDWEFTTKYLANCNSAVCIHDFVMFYRISSDSAMKRISYSHTDAIYAAERVNKYLKEKKNVFAKEFNLYMYDKTIFSVMHNFSKSRDKQLFKKLENEFDLKESMRRLLKNNNTDLKTKIAAVSYVVYPRLFYGIIGRL